MNYNVQLCNRIIKTFFNSLIKSLKVMQTSATTNQLNLIEGQFTVPEAKEILVDIFMNNIKFYKLKNFSSQIRIDKDDEFAQNQILILKNELQKFESIAHEARILNKKLIIKSEIYISLSHD